MIPIRLTILAPKMARRPQREDPESLRAELVKLLIDFEEKLKIGDLRSKVLELVKAFHKLRDLGSSLIPVSGDVKKAAKDRILQYFRKYTGKVIKSDEFLVISGIQEYARRIRELRVQEGWPIVSGQTAKAMIAEGDFRVDEDHDKIRPDTYILLEDKQDRDAAHRWHMANSIRRESWPVKKKLLIYLKNNVSKPVTGEELSYLANSAASWPRRVRELRTEEGWPIRTRSTGRPDLPVGVYVLEEIRQSEVHDRNIPDAVQVAVLTRDNYRCVKCKWSHEDRKTGDPRHLLELHHIKHHARGGENIEENLVTLCNVHHDEIHRLDKNNEWSFEEFFEWIRKPR